MGCQVRSGEGRRVTKTREKDRRERWDRHQRGALMVCGAGETLVTDSDLCSSLLAPWLSLSGDDSGDLLPGGNLPPEADPHGAKAFPATS